MSDAKHAAIVTRIRHVANHVRMLQSSANVQSSGQNPCQNMSASVQAIPGYQTPHP